MVGGGVEEDERACRAVCEEVRVSRENQAKPSLVMATRLHTHTHAHTHTYTLLLPTHATHLNGPSEPEVEDRDVLHELIGVAADVDAAGHAGALEAAGCVHLAREREDERECVCVCKRERDKEREREKECVYVR